MNKNEFINNYMVPYNINNFNILDNKELNFLSLADNSNYRFPIYFCNDKKVILSDEFQNLNFDSKFYKYYILWQNNHYNIDLYENWIHYSLNAMHAINIIINLIGHSNDNIMLFKPTSSYLVNNIKKMDRNIVFYELKSHNGIYYVDYNEMHHKMNSDKIRVLILSNPFNPIGKVWKSSELLNILDICRQEHVFVILNETYHDITFNNNFISSLSLKDGFYRDNLIVLDSPSVTFNLPLLFGCNVIIPNPQLMYLFDDYICRMKEQSNFTLSSIAYTSLYNYGNSWINGLIQLISFNYHYLYHKLMNDIPGIIISPLEGSKFAWINLSKVIKNSDFSIISSSISNIIGINISNINFMNIRLNLAIDSNNFKIITDKLIKLISQFK